MHHYRQQTLKDNRWNYGWVYFTTLYRLVEYSEALKKLEMSKIYTKDAVLEQSKTSEKSLIPETEEAKKEAKKEARIYKTLTGETLRKLYSKFKQALHKAKREGDNKLSKLVQRLTRFYDIPGRHGSKLLKHLF